MKVFRTRVTDPLNNFIAEKLAGNILKNFEQSPENGAEAVQLSST